MFAVVRALKHRNYRLFFSGQFISLIGTWMQNVAESWLVYRLANSTVLLGLVGFAGQIPVFFLASVGGAAADRFNRRGILIATQASMMTLALILATLTLSGVVQVWHVMILASLLGVTNAFDIPARQSFVVDMVGREDLTNAIALNSSLFNSARIVGPAVAGVLVAAIGEGWCFFANGVSYIAVIAGLLLMRVPPRRIEAPTGSAIAHILEGFRYVWRTRPIRAVLVQLGIISLMGMPYAVLMPVFAQNILHSGPRGLGILMGCTGIGALAGGLMLAMRRGLHGLGRWIAYATVGFGAGLILFSFSRIYWLSALLLIPAGFSFIVQMAASNTLVQAMVPDALRGRVMAVYSMMFMGMAPLGALGAGIAAARLGAPAAVMIGGVCCIVSGLSFRVRLKGLSADARELILAQERM
ncbi:MAG: MFS transporter [Acidobacteriota bacterium]